MSAPLLKEDSSGSLMYFTTRTRNNGCIKVKAVKQSLARPTEKKSSSNVERQALARRWYEPLFTEVALEFSKGPIHQFYIKNPRVLLFCHFNVSLSVRSLDRKSGPRWPSSSAEVIF